MTKERFFEITAELRNYDEWGCGKFITELEMIYRDLKKQIRAMSERIEQMENSGITDTFFKQKYKKLVNE